MGEILWKVVGIEGEPPQGLGWREPRPPGGKMRSDWRTGRGFEEWRWEVTEEVGKSTEHSPGWGRLLSVVGAGEAAELFYFL